MFVFADETGNTGKNLFDDTQPYFLTAALVTRTNFDVLCAGIQAIDVVLWLFLQFNKGRDLPPRSANLLNHVMKRGWQNDFSFIGVSEALTQKLDEIFKADLTAEQMAKGKEMLDNFEASRQENIAAFEKDGLRPFER